MTLSHVFNLTIRTRPLSQRICMRRFMQLMLYLVIVFHFLIVFAVVAAFFVLPFKQNWEIAVPLMVYISYLLLTPVDCPLTNLENFLRHKLGMKRIGGFVGNYFLKPIKIYLGIKKR